MSPKKKGPDIDDILDFFDNVASQIEFFVERGREYQERTEQGEDVDFEEIFGKTFAPRSRRARGHPKRPHSRAEGKRRRPDIDMTVGQAYGILRLSIDASKDEARVRYHVLAKRYHPDNGTSPSEKRMQHVNKAYEIVGKHIIDREVGT